MDAPVELGRTFDALADHLPVARGGLFISGRLGAGPIPLRLSMVRRPSRQGGRDGLLLRDLRAVPGHVGGHWRQLRRQPEFSWWSAAEPAALGSLIGAYPCRRTGLHPDRVRGRLSPGTCASDQEGAVSAARAAAPSPAARCGA